MRRIWVSLFSFISLLAVSFPAGAGVAAPAWSYWARKVGQSETEAERSHALTRLRADKSLRSSLKAGLSSADRGLALDAIVALGMKEFVPDLLSRVETDEDGFLTLNLNALIDGKNKNLVVTTYMSLLEAPRARAISAAAIVAMLEPLGRLGAVLPKATIEALFAHSYPEVRSGVLYYARLLSLRHANRDYHPILVKGLSSGEFQLRLQAVSILAELTRAPGVAAPMGRAELARRCKRESHTKVKGQCLWILDAGKGAS